MPQKHKRTSNAYVFVGRSGIHQNGLFARVDIPKGQAFVEYRGNVVSKKEGNRLAEENNVYVFSLDRKSDIDGSVPWNLARHANHSCHPNAESVNRNGKIWLVARRAISRGEEITYDYCYGTKNLEDAPCRCGHPECFGYIVHAKHRRRLAEKIPVS